MSLLRFDRRQLGASGCLGADELEAAIAHAGPATSLALVERDAPVVTDGAPVGDALADRICAAAGEAVVVRVEQERFAVLTGDDARCAAEAIRVAVAAQALPAVVSVSAGIAGPGDDLLGRAGAALAFARRLGGNQVRDEHERWRGLETLLDLAVCVDRREWPDAPHSQLVGNLARELADALDLPSDDVEAAHLAGTLHDAGKIRLPDPYLLGVENLAPAERAAVSSHPLHGALLVAEAGLHDAARAIAEHHERWDGCGYPRGLAGAQIAVAARIVAAADAYVSLVSDRPDRPAVAPDEALAAVVREAGGAYEPRVVATLAQLAQEGELELV